MNCSRIIVKAKQISWIGQTSNTDTILKIRINICVNSKELKNSEKGRKLALYTIPITFVVPWEELVQTSSPEVVLHHL